MFCDLIINGIPEIINFFEEMNLRYYYSKAQIKHLQAFIIAMMLLGYNGKIKEVSELSLNTERSCASRFLASDSFEDDYLVKKMKSFVLQKIMKTSKETGLPIYVIIDDTICEKTVPSSKAQEPIKGCGFHRSHLKNKTVYGHQFVTVMVQCGDLVMQYAIVLYEKGKEKESKIKIAKKIIETLPKPIKKGYILTDSWYSCKELIEVAQSKKYEFIGAVKSNRVIYPRWHKRKGIQVGEYAQKLSINDFDLVTIKGTQYYIHTYIGKAKGLKSPIKLVISYPRKGLYVKKAMKAFLSTDIKMNGWQLLQHYTKRWPIEVFYRESNRVLGMKKSQVHSLRAVKRFQYIVMLCYNFCGLEVKGEKLGFSKQRKIYQKKIKKYQITWIYEQVTKKASLESILKEFKVA